MTEFVSDDLIRVWEIAHFEIPKKTLELGRNDKPELLEIVEKYLDMDDYLTNKEVEKFFICLSSSYQFNRYFGGELYENYFSKDVSDDIESIEDIESDPSDKMLNYIVYIAYILGDFEFLRKLREWYKVHHYVGYY